MWSSLRHIQLTQSVLDMLTMLAISGRIEIANLCELLTNIEVKKLKSFSGKERSTKGIFGSTQSARNTILKAIEQGLIIRKGKKHQIEINPAMGINKEDNLLVNYQLLSVDPS